MEKESQPPEPSAMTSNATTSGQSLRHLNKSSYKISKAAPSFRKPFDPSPAPLPPPPEPAPPAETPNPNQPPVYNISKADFRDVVQKLTGSPAHDRISTPPPPPPVHSTPKPPSSRLHRIRPPPLIQIAHRPPPLLFRPPAPLSPLPPLPSCHAAAESPISAYMRFLHSSVDPSALPNPNPTPMGPPLPPNQNLPPPSSPLPPFGCFPSPKSPCPLLSSNVLFSPTGMGPLGFSQLPVSPTVPPVSSPRWRNV